MIYKSKFIYGNKIIKEYYGANFRIPIQNEFIIINGIKYWVLNIEEYYNYDNNEIEVEVKLVLAILKQNI